MKEKYHVGSSCEPMRHLQPKYLNVPRSAYDQYSRSVSAVMEASMQSVPAYVSLRYIWITMGTADLGKGP